MNKEVKNDMSYYSLMWEYYKAKNSLAKMETKMNNYIVKCEDELKKFIKVYETSDALYGEVTDNFIARSKEIEIKVNNMISTAKREISTVNTQKMRAEVLYEKYKRLYESERD